MEELDLAAGQAAVAADRLIARMLAYPARHLYLAEHHALERRPAPRDLDVLASICRVPAEAGYKGENIEHAASPSQRMEPRPADPLAHLRGLLLLQCSKNGAIHATILLHSGFMRCAIYHDTTNYASGESYLSARDEAKLIHARNS